MRATWLLILLMPAMLVGAEKLRPLSDAISAINSKPDNTDLSEVAYVGARCATLYTCVGGYLMEAGRNDEDKNLAKDFEARGKVFWNVAISINLRLKMSEENILKQAKLFVEHYSKEMADNKRLNNSAITKEIAEELTLSKAIFPLFEKMSADLAKAEKAK